MSSIRTHSFNEEQVEQLRLNKYVRSVSSTNINFTEEFKQHFHQEQKAGKTARRIFEECGFDPSVLGQRRIAITRYRINKRAKKGDGFANKRPIKQHKSSDTANESLESRLKSLENKLAYTSQEVEFLKKIQMANMEAQKKWESKHRQK